MQAQRQMTTLICKQKGPGLWAGLNYFSILVHTLLSMLPKPKLSFRKLTFIPMAPAFQSSGEKVQMRFNDIP